MREVAAASHRYRCFVLFCYFVIRLCSRVDVFFWDLKFGFNRGVLFGCSNNHQ